MAAGVRLGSYDIPALLGSGGMGDIYRPRAARLDGDVAPKMPPAAVSDDADRLLRFDREARVLASIDRPNIATVHGVEESTALRADLDRRVR